MDASEGRMEVVVGRIGRAHGIKGEVAVEPRTDEPDRRFAVGSTLVGRAPGGGVVSLTVSGKRWHSGRLLLRFEEYADRTAVEGARGIVLWVDVDPDELPEDPDEFYDHQLAGLRVEDTSGAELGVVGDILHGGAQDLLRLDLTDGRQVLFPFVKALVPVVDVPGGFVQVDDRPGLLREEEA